MNRRKNSTFSKDQLVIGTPARKTGFTNPRELELSANYYKRRGTIGSKLGRADWWIAIGIYVLLASTALVVL